MGDAACSFRGRPGRRLSEARLRFVEAMRSAVPLTYQRDKLRNAEELAPTARQLRLAGNASLTNDDEGVTCERDRLERQDGKGQEQRRTGKRAT